MTDGPRWDVFLSHSSADRAAVGVIAQRLRDQSGLRPFLDRWHLVPGVPWQAELADALRESAAAAVFIGPTGVAPWRNEEVQVALNRAVAGDDEFRVIPVLLPGVDLAGVPEFLAQRTWVDFAPGLNDDDALRRLAAAVRGEAIDGGGYELPDDPTPYRGLLRFDTDDAELFFGRTRETYDLVARVAARRFVAVEGASGSGKSSLVRAGLLPKLAAGAIAGSDRWHLLVCTPGSDPFRALARQIAILTDTSDRLSLVDELTARLMHHRDGFRTAVGDLVAHDPRPVLVVVDQFEELFTLCADDGQARCRQIAASFVAALADAVNDPASQMRVVITLRADFLGSALQLAGMSDLLGDPVLLGPLDDRALREVIAGPAKAVRGLLREGAGRGDPARRPRPARRLAAAATRPAGAVAPPPRPLADTRRLRRHWWRRWRARPPRRRDVRGAVTAPAAPRAHDAAATDHLRGGRRRHPPTRAPRRALPRRRRPRRRRRGDPRTQRRAGPTDCRRRRHRRDHA